jgi:peptidoglycan/xylan/chitin deacetylase (PgdA/CDA1 family)
MERLTDTEVRHEVQQLESLLLEAIGRKTKYFRFPGGNCDQRTVAIVERMGYRVVHWAFPSGDPDRSFTPARLTAWVLSRARPGDVLIFHINGRGYSTSAALPGIVNALRDRGVTFVKLEDGGL